MEETKTTDEDDCVMNERRKRYVANKEHEQILAKAYYQKNKDKINAKHRCRCGGIFTINNFSNHKKTIRHRDYDTQSGIFAYPLYLRKDDTIIHQMIESIK
jgi:hypothetical protein